MSKTLWDDIGRAVTGAADTVGRKGGKLVDITKLKNQIYGLERDIKKDYEAIGRLVYDQYTETGSTEKEFEELCESIAQKEILIDQYQGEIEDRKKED